MGKDEYSGEHNCLMGGMLGDERATVQLVGGGLLGIKTKFLQFFSPFWFYAKPCHHFSITDSRN